MIPRQLYLRSLTLAAAFGLAPATIALAQPAEKEPAKKEPAKKEPAKKEAVDRGKVLAFAKELWASKGNQRAALLRKAASMNDGEQRVLFSYASKQVADAQVADLIPLLRKSDSQSAAALLADIAVAPRGEADDGSITDQALEALLYGHKVSRAIPLATTHSLLTTDGHTARKVQEALLELLKEGPDDEKVSHRVMSRSLVSSIEGVLRDRDLPRGTRERAVSLVASWLADTDDLRDVLDVVKRRLEDENRVFLDALLQGIVRRSRSLRRPIDLLRAQEINRRRKLEPYKREQLADISDWLEDRVRRDKWLSKLSRRLQSDDQAFSEMLLDRLANSENRQLKLEILKLAPLYAKDADSDWVPALIPHLDSGIGQQVFVLLKKITGKNFPQNAVVWQRWYDGDEPEGGGN